MALDRTFKGADEEYEVSILDDNGAAFDLTNVNGVVVFLYDKKRSVVKKFSTNTISGFSDDITIVSPATLGQITFRTLSSEVQSASLGILTAEIRIEIDNTDFDSAIQNISTDLEIAELVESINGVLDITP